MRAPRSPRWPLAAFVALVAAAAAAAAAQPETVAVDGLVFALADGRSVTLGGTMHVALREEGDGGVYEVGHVGFSGLRGYDSNGTECQAAYAQSSEVNVSPDGFVQVFAVTFRVTCRGEGLVHAVHAVSVGVYRDGQVVVQVDQP